MNIFGKITAVLSAAAISAVSLCGAAVYAEGGENILVNGGCESDALGTSGWRFGESGGWYCESGNAAELVSDNVSEGAHALKFNSALVAQRVKLERNVTYELSFDIRSDEACSVNVGFDDGSQDWPASYQIITEPVDSGTEWTSRKIEFECPNTQDYLVYFCLWDEINFYMDNVELREKENYISRLMTGADGDGSVSFSVDYKGGEYLGSALYDSENRLRGFVPEALSGTFSSVEYGDYTVKSFLSDDGELISKSQDITYDAGSASNEKRALGKAKSLTLSAHELSLFEGGDSAAVDALIMPEFAYDNDVKWESSDTAVAEVSENGTITAKNAGTAIISAVCGELSDKCSVTVSAKKSPDGIKLDKTSIELREVDSVYPLHAYDAEGNILTDVLWSSDDENVAEVVDGVVTAAGKGTTAVTAKTSDGAYSARCSVTVTVSENTITNDTFFKDTDGNNIYSQGGAIYKFGDKYYWYGTVYGEAAVYAEAPQNGKAGNAAYTGFSCYSSDDLVNWKSEGMAFDEKCDGWAGRMGVCYNANTKKYVLIAQFAPGTLFAVSDSPTGPFKTDHIFTGTVPVENGYTGDQTIFQDDSGKAYMICSSGNGRAYQYVVPLRESDFLDFDYENTKMLFYDEDGSYIDEDGNTAKKDKTGIEGNCMFKFGGSYYFTGSDLYGWNSSRVYYLKSDSILGDYNKETGLPKIMDGSRAGFAHNSQAGFYVTVKGSENELVIYCGDRWCDFAGNGTGYNQWVPITMDGDKPYFNDLHQWKLDAKKGTWETGEGNNYIMNPEFEADRKSTNTPAGWITADNVGGYANSNLSGKADTGNFVWQQSAPEDYIADIYQDVENLPDGTYTLTAWVKSSGGQNVCGIYAESGGVRVSASVKREIGDWTEVVVSSGIIVKDGKCTVGVYSDAHAGEWVQADNFRLVRNID